VSENYAADGVSDPTHLLNCDLVFLTGGSRVFDLLCSISWQISATGSKDFRTPDGIRVAPAIELLKELI
jgi:hypothetical protein